MTDGKTDAPLEEDSAAPSAREQGLVGVLIKAIRLLEVMAEIGEPAPLRQLSKATNLPKGTLFRILQTLNSLGYIGQIEDSSFYYLTSQVSYLGRNARHEDLKMMALPLMTSLRSEFNETVNLGVLEGVFVYYLAVLEAQRPLSWRVPAGTRDMFYSTALGRAIVSQLSTEHRDALIERTNFKSRTSRTVSGKQDLIKALNDVHSSGIAFDLEENDDGVICVGAPLFLNGRVVGALSISIPATRYTPALGLEVQEHLNKLDRNFATSRGTPDQWDRRA